MMRWLLIWQPPAAREFDRLPREVQGRILDALGRFAISGQGDIRRLEGTGEPEWRLRVGGYRVRLSFDPARSVIYVMHALPRGRAYRE